MCIAGQTGVALIPTKRTSGEDAVEVNKVAREATSVGAEALLETCRPVTSLASNT